MIKLSIRTVLEVFPDEVKVMVPRETRRLKKEIKPWKDDIRGIKELFLPDYQANILIAMVNNYHGEDMKKKINHLENLEAMKRLMNGVDNTANWVTDEQIKEANRVPIKTLHVFVKAGRYGNRFRACCPFGHQDDNPSFFIFEKNRFHCFSCKENGDAINFIMKLHGLNFRDAVNYLLKGE